jgi:hypothetical protein
MDDVKSNALAMWIEATRDLVVVYRRYIVLIIVIATWYAGHETYWLLSHLNPQHLTAIGFTGVAITAVLLLAFYERSQR